MQSYVVSCAGPFQAAVTGLAQHLGVTASDLAISVMTLIPADEIDRFTDPGDAPDGDRETVVLRSGPRAGRSLRRKPRLQLRLRAGLTTPHIRRCLGLALAIHAGEESLRIGRQAPSPETAPEPAASQPDPELLARLGELQGELTRARDAQAELRAIINLLAFDLLPNGVRNQKEARYVLGLPPDGRLDRRHVKARFRQLSQVFHPDKATGDTDRMGQILDASRFLENRLVLGIL